jgi:DNA/RNA endonuclease G (NUC1)
MASWSYNFVKAGCHGSTAALRASTLGGALAVTLGCWLQKQDSDCRYTSNDAVEEIPSLASPTLPIRIIRPNPNLEIVFDVRTRTPIYVLETLTKDSLTGSKRRVRPQFYEEQSIVQPEYRSKLSHYKNTGFDRGHLAPAADFPHNMEDTFTLSNIAPQNHVVNLSLWNALEEWVRKVVKSQKDNNGTVYVVTGPLWLPRRQIDDTKYEYGFLGLGRPPSLVAVPTHFFKVVAVVRQEKIQQFACFVVQNRDPLPSKKLEDYVVPWKDLEAVTGLQFFPRWATPDWKDQADYLLRQQVVSKRGGGGNNSLEQPAPLLLTDGSSSQTSTRTLWKRARNSTLAMDDLEHLCSNSRCR